MIDAKKYTTFEHMQVSVSFGNVNLKLVLFHKPNGIYDNLFHEKFNECLGRLQSTGNFKLLILGDFNFHVDDPSNTYAKKFLETISLFDLIQHVKIQTHTAGHILDLVMSGDDLLIENIISDSTINSDHFAIVFQLSIPCPPRPRSVITYRNWKQVYFPTFDNVSSCFLQFPFSLNEGVSQYFSRTLEIADKHAPLKSKTVTVKTESPWYTNEKCLRRRLECKARRTGLLLT
jgi:hypothetical protein